MWHVYRSCFTQDVSRFSGSELIWQLNFEQYCYWVTEIQLVSSFCLCWFWFTIILFLFARENHSPPSNLPLTSMICVCIQIQVSKKPFLKHTCRLRCKIVRIKEAEKPNFLFVLKLSKYCERWPLSTHYGLGVQGAGLQGCRAWQGGLLWVTLSSKGP